MDFKDFWKKFETFWAKFRTTLPFRVLILILLSVLAVLLLQSPVVCVSLLLIPVTVLLIPHWFGERSVKHHMVNGLVFLVLATVFYGAIVTPGFLSVPQQQQAYALDIRGAPAQANLSEGFVTPFVGDAGTSFNFTVKMASRNASAGNFVVAAQILSGEGLDVSTRFYRMQNDVARGGNLTVGQYYYLNTTLPSQVHEFNFEVFPDQASLDAIANPVVGTLGSYGPHNAGFGTHFTFWLYRGAFWMIFETFGFFVLLLLYWWTRKAREMRAGLAAPAPEPGKRAEGGGEFTCTNCGADVPEDAMTCPKCGAVFEAEAKANDEPAGAKT